MIALGRAQVPARGLEIGICGQAPSDFPDEVPPFLVECGITSMSVTPDTVLRVRAAVLAAEAARQTKAPPRTASPSGHDTACSRAWLSRPASPGNAVRRAGPQASWPASRNRFSRPSPLLACLALCARLARPDRFPPRVPPDARPPSRRGSRRSAPSTTSPRSAPPPRPATACSSIGATGVRKLGIAGAGRPSSDRWHLGSCTKSMTATMLARLVERGKLAWDRRSARRSGRRSTGSTRITRPVTIEQMLAHRRGRPGGPLGRTGSGGGSGSARARPRSSARELVEGVCDERSGVAAGHGLPLLERRLRDRGARSPSASMKKPGRT